MGERLFIDHPRKRRLATLLNAVGRGLYGVARSCGLAGRYMGLPDPEAVRRILVIRADHIGDAAMCMPVFPLLRQRFPAARIAVLVGPWAEDLFRYHQDVDEVIVCRVPWWTSVRRGERGKGTRGSLIGLWRLVRRLRRERFDLAIDLRSDFRQIAVFGWLGGARKILAYARTGGEYLLNPAVPYEGVVHEVERNLRLLAPLGIRANKPDLAIPVGPAERSRVEVLLNEAGLSGGAGPLIVFHPGARVAVKRWPSDRFAALGDLLVERHGARVAVVGGAEERNLANRLCAQMKTPAVSFAGRLSLLDLVALLERTDLLVCNDGAVGHLAASVGLPTVAVFGPTDPRKFAPYNPACEVIQEPFPCSPCLHVRCERNGTEHADCLEAVSVSRVAAAAERALAGVKAGAP